MTVQFYLSKFVQMYFLKKIRKKEFMIPTVFRILSILHETFPCIPVVLCQLRYIASHLLCTGDKILVSYSIMSFQRYKIRSKKFSTGGFFGIVGFHLENCVQDIYFEYFSMTACSPTACISAKSSSKIFRP